MSVEKAKVIPLHGDPSRAGPRAARRAASPSARVGDAEPTASAEEIEAVIREFEQRRAAREPSRRRAICHHASPVLADFLRKRLTGDYAVDEFGFDPQYNDAVVLPALRFFYDKWFRVEVSGIENLPATGRGPGGRQPRRHRCRSTARCCRWRSTTTTRRTATCDCSPPTCVFDMPVLGPIARKAGHTMACNTDANRLLAGGELTAVFPEGYKGLGKPFRDRYKLQRFGRGGFVSAALRAKAPIIPCSIVGSEEIYPMLADVKLLARVLGMPYFPITPLFPLAGPAGLGAAAVEVAHRLRRRPIDTSDYDEHAADDPMVTFEITDQVRETIQQTLFGLLSQRRNTFLG